MFCRIDRKFSQDCIDNIEQEGFILSHGAIIHNWVRHYLILSGPILYFFTAKNLSSIPRKKFDLREVQFGEGKSGEFILENPGSKTNRKYFKHCTDGPSFWYETIGIAIKKWEKERVFSFPIRTSSLRFVVDSSIETLGNQIVSVEGISVTTRSTTFPIAMEGEEKVVNYDLGCLKCEDDTTDRKSREKLRKWISEIPTFFVIVSDSIYNTRFKDISFCHAAGIYRNPIAAVIIKQDKLINETRWFQNETLFWEMPPSSLQWDHIVRELVKFISVPSKWHKRRFLFIAWMKPTLDCSLSILPKDVLLLIDHFIYLDKSTTKSQDKSTTKSLDKSTTNKSSVKSK